MAKYQVLTQVEIDAALKTAPDWRYEGGKLRARFVFADFKTALRFINAVGGHAEALDHHPEWFNVYNKVDIALATHDAGGKVTTLDVALAKNIDAEAAKLR